MPDSTDTLKEIKAMILDCLSNDIPLNHKYIGQLKVVTVEDELFYAVSEEKGKLPFRFYDVGKVIFKCTESKASQNSIIKKDAGVEHTIDPGYDPSLYVKRRRTLFPYSGQTESEKRHNLNSRKNLRK